MNILNRSIADMNLGMLYLARESLLTDRIAALAALGIDEPVADVLLQMSTEELHRLAQTQVLLVALRWRKPAVWNRLRQFAAGTAIALPQALVAAEGEGDHGY